MSISAAKKRFQQLLISIAPDVTRTHGMQGHPNAKELAGHVCFLIFAIALLVSHGYNTT
jgi:hypothetical protein